MLCNFYSVTPPRMLTSPASIEPAEGGGDEWGWGAYSTVPS